MSRLSEEFWDVTSGNGCCCKNWALAVTPGKAMAAKAQAMRGMNSLEAMAIHLSR
jgi:hypothetical protein